MAPATVFPAGAVSLISEGRVETTSLLAHQAGQARLRRGLVGPRSRRAAISSTARSNVSVSTSSSVRRLAFVSPSVTYGPNRPLRTTIALPLTGSGPNSRTGGAAALRPRGLG